jgi:DNA-binding response OmpR family regulator
MSDGDNPVILIADDDPDIRRILRAHLASLHCEVIEAMDGEKTLEQIILHKPDLVILDVMMPELNGWEICKYIKSHEEYAHTGVVMLTAIGPTVNEITSPIYGADEFLDKPFEFAELDFKIKKVLSDKRSARETRRASQPEG